MQTQIAELSPDESKLLADKIIQARMIHGNKSMIPSVYKAQLLDGSTTIGLNFQPRGTKPGDTFHYDHGAGIDRNSDAIVLWVKAQ